MNPGTSWEVLLLTSYQDKQNKTRPQSQSRAQIILRGNLTALIATEGYHAFDAGYVWTQAVFVTKKNCVFTNFRIRVDGALLGQLGIWG